MRVFKSPYRSYVKIVEIPKEEISKIDFDMCAQPRQTLKDYYDNCEVKPAIICNGGFFSMTDGTTCFTYADDGRIINFEPNYNKGMGISAGSLTFGNLNEISYTDFISAYPVLMENGKAIEITDAQEINYKARRTVLAYDDNNIYIIAVEFPGMTFAELQKLLMELGVKYAINLDGGGSTKILEYGKSITSIWHNRPVDNVVAVYLKPKEAYKVQIGAFRNELRAKNCLAAIHQTPDTIGAGYKFATLRQDGKIYKVQVGAYRTKAAAARVVTDLQKRNYAPFIISI